MFLSQDLERLGHNSGANTLVLLTLNHLWHMADSGHWVANSPCVWTHMAHLDWMLPAVNSAWGQQGWQQVSIPYIPPLIPKVVTLASLQTPCHMSSLLRVCVIFALRPQENLPVDVLSYTQCDDVLLYVASLKSFRMNFLLIPWAPCLPPTPAGSSMESMVGSTLKEITF